MHTSVFCFCKFVRIFFFFHRTFVLHFFSGSAKGCDDGFGNSSGHADYVDDDIDVMVMFIIW